MVSTCDVRERERMHSPLRPYIPCARREPLLETGFGPVMILTSRPNQICPIWIIRLDHSSHGSLILSVYTTGIVAFNSDSAAVAATANTAPPRHLSLLAFLLQAKENPCCT